VGANEVAVGMGVEGSGTIVSWLKTGLMEGLTLTFATAGFFLGPERTDEITTADAPITAAKSVTCDFVSGLLRIERKAGYR